MRILGMLVIGAALLLPGCSSAKKEEVKEEVAKPEPITGRNGFYKVYVAARTWAPDIQCLRVTSIQLTDLKAEPGKAAAWQVVVVSPSKQRMRSYTWSAIEAPGNLHQGVFAGPEDGYVQRGTAKPFLTAALKIDTSDAWKIAMEKGADYMKKNPDEPINFSLELGDKHPNPAWRVIWGSSAGTSGFSVFVDATTGQYLETRR